MIATDETVCALGHFGGSLSMYHLPFTSIAVVLDKVLHEARQIALGRN